MVMAQAEVYVMITLHWTFYFEMGLSLFMSFVKVLRKLESLLGLMYLYMIECNLAYLVS